MVGGGAVAQLCARVESSGDSVEPHQVCEVVLENIHDLRQAVTASLERIHGEGHLLRPFFQYAGLEV